ncbi:MAG TPA: hypothetical protein P5121_35805 [Caldilineaceae bacterium]|nr:hypothetical protein [Caldilineaceae bacterium]
MTEPHPNNLETNFYRSYLVRFWQSNAQGNWRAAAQCVQTGDTKLFRDRESLLAFLRTDFCEKGEPIE